MGYANKSIANGDIMEPTNIAYADETSYNVGRYRGIALISLNASNMSNLSEELNQIITQSDITEFKWAELSSARYRFAAQKMFDFSIQNALNYLMRVDVLTWDTEDKRHKIQGRDDIANLQRMYYHLFKNVMHKRWPHRSTWALNPDVNSAIKWEQLFAFLKLADVGKSLKETYDWRSFAEYMHRFGIIRIEPKDSKDEPFIQLADLFAGIAVYSRSKYDHFEKWKNPGSQQVTLFREPLTPNIKLSKTDKVRCDALNRFYTNCSKNKLGVSLKRNRGLRTFNPSNPINFWWYESQHDNDKAPVKGNSE